MSLVEACGGEAEAVLDALEAAEVYMNDNQIVDLRVRWGAGVPDGRVFPYGCLPRNTI